MGFCRTFRKGTLLLASGAFLLFAPIHTLAQIALPFSSEGINAPWLEPAFRVFEEEQSAGPALRLYAEFERLTVKPGASVTLYLRGFVPAGWHIYSIHPQGGNGPYPTSIEAGTRVHQPLGALRESAAVRKWDGALEMELAVHLGSFTLEQDFHIAEDTKEGIHDLTGTLLFQACDNRICVPLKRLLFTAPLEIVR